MPTTNPAVTQLVEKFTADIERLFREAALNAVQDTLKSALGDSTLRNAIAAGQSISLPVAGAKRGPAPKKGAKGANGAAKAAPAAAPKAAPAKAGKRIRRSPAEIDAMAGRIVSYVRTHANQRSEVIRAALGIEKTHWIQAFRKLVDSKQLIATGQKRSTTLSLPGSSAAAAPAKAAPKAAPAKAAPPKVEAPKAVPPIKRVKKA
ncbi:MAG: hypothetical protein HOW73_15265 [Polyangiaceae bacterium]|nr:hypothetical protein [Polyangiaceae bacterium]